MDENASEYGLEITDHSPTHDTMSKRYRTKAVMQILVDFSLTVKAATFIIISGRGSAVSSAKEGKSGIIYNLVKS